MKYIKKSSCPNKRIVEAEEAGFHFGKPASFFVLFDPCYTQNTRNRRITRITGRSLFVATLLKKRDPGVYITKAMIPLGAIILTYMIIFWGGQAHQMDKISRWLMPLLYLGLMLAMYFLYTK